MTTVVPVSVLVADATPPAPLPAAACTVVIFGATGDLTSRKLMPALYDLRRAGALGDRCEVVGVGRTPLSDEEFRARLRASGGAAAAASAGDGDDARWRDFERHIRYVTGDPNDPGFYPALAARLEGWRQGGASPNRLFYVATPAAAARPIVEGLGAAGLARSADGGWSRVVLEKPFGHDLRSAQELNGVVNGVFPESAVFRIDHYLGKETVQNLLVFRFGNTLFEPVWNRNYVDYVEISAAETLGVERRAAFYETTGALRDMVANHLLQLLALTAMEPPVAFDADAVREQKVQLLRAIHPMTADEVAHRVVRGQYGPGAIDERPAPGYREEPGVAAASSTETFVAAELRVENWRWAGVPFYVRTGKRLGRKMTEIRVHFRPTPQALFARTPDAQRAPNLITLRIQPDEWITIAFAAKRPGAATRAVSVGAEFSYAEAFAAAVPDAYATLLHDAMRGDQTRFTRGDEVEAEWRIVTPIQEAWTRLPPPAFPNYPAGSDGPREARSLLEGRAHRWCTIGPTDSTDGAGAP